MKELITVNGTYIFTDSKIIAKGTGNQHKSVIALIKKQSKRLERFGILRFSDLKSTNPKGGRPTKICYLNEEQATLLITFLDNTDIVADFKVELVHQFYEMRRFILERQTTVWLETRQQGKLTRKAETDVIQQLVEYAKSQRSEHADGMYLTENLDKVRQMIGNGQYGDNRPERMLKQWNVMNTEERIETRDELTKLAAMLQWRFKQQINETEWGEFFQKDMCVKVN